MLSLLFDWQAPVVFIESNVLTFDPARSRKDAGIVATLRKGTKQKPRDVALGHKQTFPDVCAMSAIPPKADVGRAHWDIARWFEMKEATN